MRTAPLLLLAVLTGCSGEDLGEPMPNQGGRSGAPGSADAGRAGGVPGAGSGPQPTAGSAGAIGVTGGSATAGTSSAGATSGGATTGGATTGGATSGGATSGGATSGGATSGGVTMTGNGGGGTNAAGAPGSGGAQAGSPGNPNTGGSGSAQAGRSGRGGSSTGTGGNATGMAGQMGTAGGPASSASCSVLLSGATGEEAMGQIPTCCTPSASEKEFVDQAFALLNEYRMSLGLSALAYDDALEAPIQGHSVHQAVHPFRLSHDAPEQSVSSPGVRATACNATRSSGENIAWNYRTPTDVMTGWRNSSGHDQNMRGNHTRVGIGYHLSATREHWWGQLFGR